MGKIAASQINGLLKSAQAHEKEGQWPQAEPIYRQILASYPARVDVNTALLNGLIRTSHWPAVEAQAKSVIAIDAQSSAGWVSLAHALLAQNKNAMAACESAVKVARESVAAHDFLGIALRRAGRYGDAIQSFQRALKIQPDASGTLVNLANTLKEMGRLQDAIRQYQKALALEPNLVQAQFNMGVAWHAAGNLAEAKDCFYKVLSKAPGFAEAHNGLGLLYKEQSQLHEAVRAFEAAIQLLPTFADAHYNLGVVLHDQSQLQRAAASFGAAIALAPQNGMFRVAQLTATLAVVPANADEASHTVQVFDDALQAHTQWRENCHSSGTMIGFDTISTLPFWLAYRAGNQMARLSRFADGVRVVPDDAPLPGRPVRDKIRLGIVSHHFRRHSVWDVIVKGLLEHMDRSRFELCLYHLSTLEDAQTAWAKSVADVWKDAQTVQGPVAWATAIADDQPDALFYPEIGMDPITYLLAKQRLAPLQLAGWGHPITTGLDTIDGYCSGALLEPDDAQEHYRERLLTLPGTGCCTTPIADAPEAIDAVLALLQGPGPVLLFAHMPFKLDPAHDGVLAQVAKGIGPCKIVIPKDPKVGQATDLLVTRLTACLQQHGVDQQVQIVVIPWLQQAQFKTLLAHADLYLDCPSFSGYTTAWMAAHAGIPIVCWDGPFMRQRLAAGLLKRIGVTDTIAASLDDYVAIAVALAHEDPAQRQQRRSAIRAAAVQADGDLRVVRAFEDLLVRGVANPQAL